METSKLVLHEKGDKKDARIVEAMHGGVGKGWAKPLFADKISSHKLRFIHYAELLAGSSCGVHGHPPRCEEIWYILEGEGLLTTDTAEYKVGPHDAHLVKSGGVHGVKNTGNKELKWLCINLIQEDK